MDVLLLLGREALSHLSKRFAEIEIEKAAAGKGLTSDEFVQVVLEEMSNLDDFKEKKKTYTLSLYKLFSEIDIDGDGTVTWEEFSEHCIETGISATFCARDETGFRYYEEKRSWKDNFTKHPTLTKWIDFLGFYGLLAVCEERTRYIKFFDSEMSQVCCMDTALDKHEFSFSLSGKYSETGIGTQAATGPGKKSATPVVSQPKTEGSRESLLSAGYGIQRSVLDLEFCPSVEFESKRKRTTRRLGTIVTTSSDMTVSFWEFLQGMGACRAKRVARKRMKYPQSVLHWDNLQRVLYSTDATGVITIWEVENEDSSKINRICGKLRAHTDRVTSFISIQNLGLLFTASLDTTIKIWRVHTENNLVSLDGEDGVAPGVENAVQDDKTSENKSSEQEQKETETEGGNSDDADNWKQHTVKKKDGPKRKRRVVGRVVGELSGHRHGVTDMATVVRETIIVSAGYDNEVLCWCPKERMLLCRLFGHRFCILGVRAVPRANDRNLDHLTNDKLFSTTQQVLTMDAGGNFRVWAISYEACMGNKVYCTQEVTPWACVTPRSCEVLYPSGHLLVAGYTLHFFDAGSKEGSLGSNGLESSSNPVGMGYNKATNTFVAALGQSVWVWNGSTGRADRIFQDICSSEITCLALDERGRKLYVGTQKGTIEMFNYLNGTKLRVCNAHTKDISDLSFVNEDGCLVSVSWDRSMKVVCEIPKASSATGMITSYELAALREVNDVHEKDIVCVDVSRSLSLIATGSADFSILVWDFTTFTFEGILTDHTCELTCLCFVDGRPALVSADCRGTIMIWPVRPRWDKYERPLHKIKIADCVTQIRVVSIKKPSRRRHRDPIVRKARPTFKDNVVILLLVSDEEGHANVYDFGPMLDWLHLDPVDPKKLPVNWANYNPKRRQLVPTDFQGVFTEYIERDKTKGEDVQTLVPIDKTTGTSFRGFDINNPERVQEGKPLRGLALLMNRRSSMTSIGSEDGNPKKAPAVLEVLSSWKAHNTPVTGLTVIVGAETFATTGCTPILKIWTFSGDEIGNLICSYDQTVEPDLHWDFTNGGSSLARSSIGRPSSHIRRGPKALSEKEAAAKERRRELKLAAHTTYKLRVSRENMFGGNHEQKRLRQQALAQISSGDNLTTNTPEQEKLMEAQRAMLLQAFSKPGEDMFKAGAPLTSFNDPTSSENPLLLNDATLSFKGSTLAEGPSDSSGPPDKSSPLPETIQGTDESCLELLETQTAFPQEASKSTFLTSVPSEKQSKPPLISVDKEELLKEQDDRVKDENTAQLVTVEAPLSPTKKKKKKKKKARPKSSYAIPSLPDRSKASPFLQKQLKMKYGRLKLPKRQVVPKDLPRPRVARDPARTTIRPKTLRADPIQRPSTAAPIRSRNIFDTGEPEF